MAHPLAVFTLHATQAPPAVPQLFTDGMLQVLPVQQPLAQVWALHPAQAPLKQPWPIGQIAHMLPAAPQDWVVLPGRQVVPLQQPLQESALQTHWPPRHCWVSAHEGPLPQRQAPATQESLAIPLQVVQAPPPIPQSPTDGTAQALLRQQPFGHDCALQTHWLLLQRCPTAHCAPLPQRQPWAVQTVERVASQAAQATPLVPQVISDDMVQVAPAQQPIGHDAALQTQAPATQRWPAPQAAPMPHAHLPARQESATLALQATQAAAPVPQFISVGIMLQVLPAQQPMQLFGLQAPRQTPLVHMPMLAHAAHAAPPAPQTIAVLPAWQTPIASQQPFGHETLLQAQAPLTHCWPSAQAALPAQVHLPAEQPSAVTMSQAAQAPPPVPQVAKAGMVHAPLAQQPLGQVLASQAQAPLAHLPPIAQAAPLPQEQAPLVHPSPRAGSQTAQAAPPVPQVIAAGIWQTPLASQQPFGQDIASQTQAPFAQRVPMPHTAPMPHWQVPLPQLSAELASQAMQAPPAVPHAITDGT